MITPAQPLLALLDSETVDLVREALALPDGQHGELPTELDATGRAYTELMADLVLFREKGTSTLRARMLDVARALGMDDSTLRQKVKHAEQAVDGADPEIGPDDVHLGVRAEDIDRDAIREIPPEWLPEPVRGWMTLSTDAILLLAMTSRGARGRRLRRQVKAIVDAFPRLQRLCIRLLRAHDQRPDPVLLARELRLAGDAAGAISLLRAAAGLPPISAQQTTSLRAAGAQRQKTRRYHSVAPQVLQRVAELVSLREIDAGTDQVRISIKELTREALGRPWSRSTDLQLSAAIGNLLRERGYRRMRSRTEKAAGAERGRPVWLFVRWS